MKPLPAAYALGSEKEAAVVVILVCCYAQLSGLALDYPKAALT
jgi:hypothetical protein